MIIVGLTGNLGTGKTTVSEMFAKCGAVVIDADVIAHDLLKKGNCYRQVKEAFPKVVVEKKIDRKILADIVFKHPRKLKMLEGIVHPAVKRELKKVVKVLTQQSRAPKMVVLDVPLLFEAGLPTGEKVPAVIMSVEDQIISVDLNHPLAGKRLNFKIKLSSITSS